MAFRLNPLTGELDLVGSASSTDAQRVVKAYTAQETISALKLVRIQNGSDAYLASPSSTYESARVLGVALNAALTGQTVSVLEFGELTDATFAFTAGVPLFLGSLAAITDVPVTNGFLIKVGYSLGNFKIQVDLGLPIQL